MYSVEEYTDSVLVKKKKKKNLFITNKHINQTSD